MLDFPLHQILLETPLLLIQQNVTAQKIQEKD
jgi:hypothetical protein